MRRIQPPNCTICEQRNAEYESDVWPTLRLCVTCRAEAIRYCIEEAGVIHGNPILIELALPGDNGNRPDAIRIWRQRPNQTSTYFGFFIKYESEDSTIAVDTTLDFLDQL